VAVNNSVPYDINKTSSVVAIILINTVGPAAYITQPGLVQGFVELLGFTEREAGYAAAAEMWGVAATTIFFTFLTGLINWRTAVTFASITMVIGNLLSVSFQDPSAFAVVRGIVGIGEGVLISLGFTMVGLTRHTDRNFGYMVMCILLFGALVIAAMPSLFATVGFNGVLHGFAAMSLIPLFLRQLIPSGSGYHVESTEGNGAASFKVRATAVACVFAFFVAVGSVWAYLFLLGIKAGGSEQSVANAIMIAQFAGAAGALSTATLADRFGRAKPIVTCLALCLLSQFLMADGVAYSQYWVGVIVFNFALNMAHPYLYSLLANIDPSARIIRFAIAGQMLGIALGPSIAASMITADELTNVTLVSVAFFVAALVLVQPALSRQFAPVRVEDSEQA